MKPRSVDLYMPRGDARVYPFEVDEDISGGSFRFVARYAENDSMAVITLDTATNGIVVTDGPAGLAEIRIPPSATSTFDRPVVLVWDLEHVTGAGPETILAGRLHIYPDVSHS